MSLRSDKLTSFFFINNLKINIKKIEKKKKVEEEKRKASLQTKNTHETSEEMSERVSIRFF